jgi:hypothetical protein
VRVNYDELAALVNSMPRIPRRELRCHPVVVMQLREEARWTGSRHTYLWKVYDLLACPVFTDPAMDCGAWEVCENDVVVASGNTWS